MGILKKITGKKNMGLKLILVLFFAVTVYFSLLIWSGRENLRQAFANYDLKWFFLALGLSSLNFILRYFRWVFMLKDVNFEIPHKINLPVFFSGLAFTMTPGKAGEAVKSYFLKKKGYSVVKTLSVVFMERYSDLIAVLLLAGIGLPFHAKGYLAFFFSVLLVFFVFFFSSTRLGHRILLYFFRKIAFFQRFQVQIKALLTQIKQFSRQPKVFFYLVMGMIGWGLEALALYYLALGAGIPISWWQAVFIFSISTLAGIVFPGGLGGMEGMLVFLLAPLAIKSQVVLVIFLLRLATLWWATLSGSCFLVFLLKKNLSAD
ncbi:MAG: lysylphosphatidylglycerol synthase transmembrane domain-containing protein [Deltaproteobacteria bacterium]|jgi:uncharacterized protein (TIRG00374 family)|nr:lysylphosphatidylglycerol synthase transmembrane domain-containing protein [Deltaproteobacteria bacterium]